MGDCGGKANRIQSGSPAHDNYVTASIQIGLIHDFQHAFKDMHVILDCFPTSHHLGISAGNEPVGIPAAECMNPLPQVGIRRSNTLIQPELDAWRTVFGRFDQVCKNVGVGPKDIL
jgi:hypothetical protein